jgi:hypothetical protein
MTATAARGWSLRCRGRDLMATRYGFGAEPKDKRAFAIDEWSLGAWRWVDGLRLDATMSTVNEGMLVDNCLSYRRRPIATRWVPPNVLLRPPVGLGSSRPRNIISHDWGFIGNIDKSSAAGEAAVNIVAVTGLELPEALVARGDLAVLQEVEMLVGV